MKPPSLLRSFLYALRGLRLGLRTERSFRVEVAIAIFVMTAAVFFPLITSERIMIFFVVMVVLVLELINSAMERIVDLVKPRFDDQVKEIKDLLAGAVFMAALFSILIGAVIFGPYMKIAL